MAELTAFEFQEMFGPLLSYFDKALDKEAIEVYFEGLKRCDKQLLKLTLRRIIDREEYKKLPKCETIRKVYVQLRAEKVAGAAPSCKACRGGWVEYWKLVPGRGSYVRYSARCAHCAPRSEYPQVVISDGVAYWATRAHKERGRMIYTADLSHLEPIEGAVVSERNPDLQAAS